MTTQLNSLGKRLSPADRKRIEIAITKRVEGELLSKTKLARFERGRAQLLGR